MGRISQIPVPENTLDVPEAFEPHPLVRHPDVENVEIVAAAYLGQYAAETVHLYRAVAVQNVCGLNPAWTMTLLLKD